MALRRHRYCMVLLPCSWPPATCVVAFFDHKERFHSCLAQRDGSDPANPLRMSPEESATPGSRRGGAQENRRFIERLARLRQRGEELPSVRRGRPDLEVAVHRGVAGAGEAPRIVQQNLVFAYVKQDRWKAGEFRIQGRGQRIADIGAAKVPGGRSGEGSTTAAVGAGGVASDCEVGPGGEHGCSGGQRFARVAEGGRPAERAQVLRRRIRR